MEQGLPSYCEGLNEKQLQAVTHGQAPLLILAGAGSGKTRVITTRIAYLIDRLHFAPDQILAVTFTNKAAREMSDRVSRLVQDSQGLLIKTFHSFCAWLLRRNAPLAGLDPYFTIYDDEDSLALLKTVLPAQKPANEIRTLLHGISRAKDDGLTPEDDLRGIVSHRDFAEIFRLYEEKLALMGNVDFGGLIQKSVALLRDHPGVRTRMHQKFQVVLVDEYQDSNGAQFELLRLLYGPQTWLAVVGDDDQSIYGFRGADVSHILTFEKKFPGTEIIKLEENYRSTGAILALAGEVVSQNKGRLGKTLWTRQGQGQKPVMAFLEDQDAEALYVAQKVKRSPLKETAVLYRTNAQSRAFESVFVRERIPYRIVGTLKFFEREEVKDVMAWLTFLSNPRDEVAWTRIVNKPARGLGKTAVSQILGYRGPDGHLVDACGLALGALKGKARQGLDTFLSLAGEFLSGLETPRLAELVHRVAVGSGLWEYYQEQDRSLGSQNKKTDNLEELLNAASPFPGGRTGLSQFLERVSLDTSSEEKENAPAGVVTLITMHNTKGLEFDRVFITGLEEGLFPRVDSARDPDELEEERRLFYVAITRAKEELFLLSCRLRVLHGRIAAAFPSRFLEEIPPSQVTQEGARPQGGVNYFQGMRINHQDYGDGTIVKKLYTGDELVVDVRFDSGRVARFFPAYQSLERIAQDE